MNTVSVEKSSYTSSSSITNSIMQFNNQSNQLTQLTTKKKTRENNQSFVQIH